MNLSLDSHNPALGALLDRLHLALFTVDATGRIAGWSAGAERLTGHAAKDVLGRVLVALDTEDEQGLAAVWARLSREPEAFFNDVLTLRHAAGHDLSLLGDLRRVCDEAGEFAGVVGGLTLFEPHLLANRRLARVVSTTRSVRAFHTMLGESPPMQAAFDELGEAAGIEVTVLIRGETGTGKELAARAIHALSARKDQPLVCVNCSAIPDPLLESELFGHVRGAFTGATRDKAGVFEEADGGVLFLDEIGDLGPSVQVKLLRALQEREVRRVGGDRTRRVDVRIVTATNRDLAAMVAAGQFREDLYYRIRVFELLLPPLRERKGDVRLLTEHCLATFNERHGKQVARVEDEAMDCLERYAWPGNVRELRNAIEHAFVRVKTADSIGLRHLPEELRSANEAPRALERGALADAAPAPLDERARIVAALREAGGKKTLAASMLGMSRVTLWKKIKKHQISAIY